MVLNGLSCFKTSSNQFEKKKNRPHDENRHLYRKHIANCLFQEKKKRTTDKQINKTKNTMKIREVVLEDTTL